jgi:ABC-2 type transport system permease protein
MTNSIKLTRFMLRRERVISSIWIVVLVFFSVALVPGMEQVIGQGGGQEELLATLTTPSMIAMMGPLYCENAGGLFAFMMLLWTMLAVGIMNIFLVVRHTRADEERGRTEVIRPVGRSATLGAALLTALVINVALALLTGAGMAAAGADGFGFGACLLYGVLLGVFGMFCAAVTAIFCQLCTSSRGALACPAIVTVGGYMVRAVGDMPDESGAMPNELLSYFSPMGLLQRSEVFVNNRLWVVFAVLGITAALTAAAFALNRARDMGEGFIAAKPGRKSAKPALLRPFGLQMRLLRGTLIWWAVGLFLTAALYGSIMGNIGGFIEGNDFYGELMIDIPPEIAEMLGDADAIQAKSFAATINIMLMICSVIPVLLCVFKLKSEESHGRLEAVLAGRLSRRRILAGYVSLAFAASLLMPISAAVGFWLSASSVMENPLEFSFFAEGALVYLPALWVMLGLAAALIGFAPKATLAAWGYMVYAIFVMFFGGVLALPDWVARTTPFGYVPLLIIEEVNPLTMSALTAVAAVLTIAGFVGYRRRDMAG